MKKIEQIRNFMYLNGDKLILFIAVIFFISMVTIGISTDWIIDHDREKVYSQMDNAVEENKEEIISLSNYDRIEIKVDNNITIKVKKQNVEVRYKPVYSQYYTINNNSLKKENEVMYLSFESIAACFAIFLIVPFFISVCLFFIVYFTILIIIKFAENIN